MNIGELAKELNLKILTGEDDSQVSGGIASDLLSYVMGKGKEGQIWLTIQVHENIIAVASLLGLAGVIIADGKIPGDGTVKSAEKHMVTLCLAKETVFELSGKLYKIGVK